ncbi:MAG TPA: hypothetical protein VFW25_13660 [Silvibacterium sp.]|nr:hypothetical protein [Silvibacterium sp.]
MPKKAKPRTYDELLSQLRQLQFDVRGVPSVANQVMVSRYGCGAILGRDSKGAVAIIHKPGVLLGGEIAILLDRGYQKFFKTPRLEMAATADLLKAEHRFTEELDALTGGIDLYNDALGTVSDEYMYDRLEGRNQDSPARGAAPWDAGVPRIGH